MARKAKEKDKGKAHASIGWKQRKGGERSPEYGGGTKNYFTLEIHYGGSFGEWGYYDGDVEWFDYVDPDRFSLMELNKMVVGLVKKEDYMQYLWLPDEKDINSGLVPIYNDEDVATMVEGRKGGRVEMYVRDLTDDEVDQLINSHVEQVQMMVETSHNRSRVRIEEIVDEHIPTQKVAEVLGKRKRTDSAASVLLLGWREDPSLSPNDTTPVIDRIGADVVVAQGEAQYDTNKHSTGEFAQSGTEAHEVNNNQNSGDGVPRQSAVPKTTKDHTPVPTIEEADSDDESDDSSIELIDSDVDIYDDNDVQERFQMDSMWQDSQARDKDPVGADSGQGRDCGEKDATVNGSRGSGEGVSDRNKSSGGSNSGKQSRSFRTEPEPQDVDSDMETDESGFARKLVFDSDDEEENRRPSFPEWNREQNLRNPEFQVGMIFTDLAEFKEACKAHAVITRRPVLFHPNDRRRCQCLCKQKCDFKMWASWLPKDGYAQIRSANFTHTCGVVQDLRACTKEFLATKYLERFRLDPTWAMSNIIHTVQTDLGLHISHMKAFRTKRHALGLIHVDVYKSTYERSIRPLNDSSQWTRSELEPLNPPRFPPPRRGAKQTKRRKEAGELEIPRVTRKGVFVVAVSRKGASMTCSKCSKRGHNRRGCKENGNSSTSSAPAGGSPSAGRPRRTQPSTDSMEFMPTPRVPVNDSPARNTRSKTTK